MNTTSIIKNAKQLEDRIATGDTALEQAIQELINDNAIVVKQINDAFERAVTHLEKHRNLLAVLVTGSDNEGQQPPTEETIINGTGREVE